MTEALSLTCGLRLDHHEKYGNHVTPRLYANHDLGRGLMLKAGMRSVIAADHSKFGRVALARICELSEADTILTDNGLEEETLTRLRRLPVDILTV